MTCLPNENYKKKNFFFIDLWTSLFLVCNDRLKKTWAFYLSTRKLRSWGTLIVLCVLGCATSVLAQSSQVNGNDMTSERIKALNLSVKELSEKGNYLRALPLATRSLEMSERAFGLEDPMTWVALLNLSRLYSEMGKSDESLPIALRSLEVAEASKTPEKVSVSMSLILLGNVYADIGDYEKALPLYKKALSITDKEQEIGNALLVDSLYSLAGLYTSMGVYEKAFPLLERAVKIAEDTQRVIDSGIAIPPNNFTGSYVPLTNAYSYLAQMYLLLGKPEEALKLSRRVLEITERDYGREHPQTAKSMANLANIYQSLGDYGNAVNYASNALEISEKSYGPEHPFTGIMLNNLAGIYGEIQDYKKALPLVMRAVHIAEKTLGSNHPTTGMMLSTLAELYQQIGDSENAKSSYQTAFVIGLTRFRTVGDPELISLVAGNLCVHKSQQKVPDSDAIFYCKFAVNVRQAQRASVNRINGVLSKSLTRRIEEPYFILAKLLTADGRISEAEQALLALKDFEYIQHARDSSGFGAPMLLTPKEKQLVDEMNSLADRLAKAYVELELVIDDVNSERLTLLQAQIAVLHQQLTAKLEEISARLYLAGDKVASSIDLKNTELTQLTDTLVRSEYGESTAIVMFVPEASFTTVIITGPSGPSALQLPVGSNTINPLIDAMRIAILSRRAYQSQAQELYRLLISPVEQHLRDRKIDAKTLMLYLTGRLRYLPFAALMDQDGSHLIEKYRLALFTAATRSNVGQNPRLQWSISALGSTRPDYSENLTSLPRVKDELDAIVRTDTTPFGALPGQALLDSQFTREVWNGVLSSKPGKKRNSVLHIATHFKSLPGDWQHSFLLLGDGNHFTLSELDQALSINLSDVELVTLSACSTELTDVADGSEFEGLGAVFQKKGARAVIGTLWSVQDESGATFMRVFYEARGEQRKMSKAAALQSAQMSLLRKKIKSNDPEIDLSHPYYWAPFILMGNWM